MARVSTVAGSSNLPRSPLEGAASQNASPGLSTIKPLGSDQPLILARPNSGRHAVTSQFGMTRGSGNIRFRKGTDNHGGVDIAAVEGTPVYAILGGEVWVPTSENAMGLRVWITSQPSDTGTDVKHEIGYGHLSAICVENGVRVEQGDLIGYTGISGNADPHDPGGREPHLHLQWKVDGKLVDPEKHLGHKVGMPFPFAPPSFIERVMHGDIKEALSDLLP